MDAPELVDAVAKAIASDVDFDLRGEVYREGQRLRAKRALAVPAIAAALERDRQVAEMVKVPADRSDAPRYMTGVEATAWAIGVDHARCLIDATLYPETGK